ncbi:hypothetical protein SDC9_191839 [bioreactor metagenome]|uniref:Uncharacterized protein n=1 Tax=bioreactor metagenome TaxID=1076179 RepID=A0A645HZ25_9ZZZZ
MPTVPLIDRSIEPSMMTNVSPSATTIGIANCFISDDRFFKDAKFPPHRSVNTSISAIRTPTGATFMIRSFRLLLRTRSANSSMMDLSAARRDGFAICLSPFMKYILWYAGGRPRKLRAKAGCHRTRRKGPGGFPGPRRSKGQLGLRAC